MRPNSDSEILIILRQGATPPPEALASGRIAQSVSERVFTLDIESPAGLASLQSAPAVYWSGTSPPHHVRDELTPAERLFIDGWLLRRAGKSARPGEGLDWDAPGRLPP